jgi:hypothetical protein
MPHRDRPRTGQNCKIEPSFVDAADKLCALHYPRRDEARRMAANFAKLPELRRRKD